MLASSPLPVAGEHVAGYIRRLAIANALPSLRMLGTLHDVGPMSPIGVDASWRSLARATGLPIGMLQAMRWKDAGRNSHRWLDVGGDACRLTDLDLRHLRHCPACLAADGIVRQVWSIRCVTACPIHRTSLVDACADCGRTLLLDERTSLFDCAGCGAPFAGRTGRAAEDGAIAIAIACGASPRDVRPATTFDPLFALPPGRAAAVVGHLARLAASRRPPDPTVAVDHARLAPPLAEAGQEVRDALSLLAHWPEAYLEFLSAMPSRTDDGSAAGSTSCSRPSTIRPPLDEQGRPIGFVVEPTDGYRKEAFGAEPRRRAPGRNRRSITAGSAKVASLPGGFQPISHAAAMGILEGREDDRLAHWWVAAGLLTERHDVRGTVLSLDEVTELRLRLDVEDGRVDAGHVRLDHVDLKFTKGRDYRKDRFLIDVFAGRIASVRVDDGSALGGLAFDRRDLERLRAQARLSAWRATDAHVALTRFVAAARPVYGAGAMPTMADCNAAAQRGTMRFEYYLPPTPDARRQKRWAVRDLVDAIECGRPQRMPYARKTSKDEGSRSR